MRITIAITHMIIIYKEIKRIIFHMSKCKIYEPGLHANEIYILSGVSVFWLRDDNKYMLVVCENK